MLRAIFLLWKRDLLHYWRNRTKALVALTMPLLWLFIFGTGISATQLRPLGDGPNYIQFIFPGMIAMSLIFNAIFSTIATIQDKESGFLKEILVSPVPRSSIVFGRSLGAATTAAIQASLILVLAPLVGLDLSVVLIVQMFMIALFSAFALSSLGMALVAFFDNQDAFQYVINFVNMPMFFLSGALFPLRDLPAILQFFVQLNPASYAVYLLRSTLFSSQNIESDATGLFAFSFFGQPLTSRAAIFVLLGFSILFLGIGTYLFERRDQRV